MAYFSNGTEGIIYEERLCENCIHRPLMDTPEQRKYGDCPIVMLHMAWNYEQFDDTPESKAKKSALDTLIPRTEDGRNTDCRMFTARGADCDQRNQKTGQH